MNLNLDGLRAVRDRRPSAKEEWRPLVLDDLARMSVLAVDQSLNATACVLVRRDNSALHVVGVAQLAGESPEEFQGNERHLRRAVSLYHKLAGLLACPPSAWGRGSFDLVHEAPPVGGGTQRTTESTLLASLALRLAAETLPIPVQPMISAQQHKKAICGNAIAKKAEEHAALRKLVDTLPITGFEQISNPDKRDALCIAITHLARMKA
jgi:hypothetical protein